MSLVVVICLKICTFVVSITTFRHTSRTCRSCDLLENLYLCGIYNNIMFKNIGKVTVVICLKICTFVVSITTDVAARRGGSRCDLLENLYLCGIYNNLKIFNTFALSVVICLKICTFVVSITTSPSFSPFIS